MIAQVELHSLYTTSTLYACAVLIGQPAQWQKNMNLSWQEETERDYVFTGKRMKFNQDQDL